MNTVTRAQLAEAVYANVGLSRNESAALLETVLERMSAALEAGEPVKISAFGTFLVRQKGQRVGRNPKTGIEVPITFLVRQKGQRVGRNPKTGIEVPILPRKVLSFRPSQVLKARINNEPVGEDA